MQPIAAWIAALVALLGLLGGMAALYVQSRVREAVLHTKLEALAEHFERTMGRERERSQVLEIQVRGLETMQDSIEKRVAKLEWLSQERVLRET